MANFSLEYISQIVHEWLYAMLPAGMALLVEFILVGVLVISLFAVLGLVLIMMERKVSSWMQLRLGPNRVGPGGMFQTVADTIKLIVKEGMTPASVDKLMFNLAPYVVMVIAMVVMAPIAFAKGFQIWDINIGVLFVAAVSSVSVIGVLMAGYASNNKYSLLGAMRSGAQIVSYELSAGLSILTVVVLSGSLKVSGIIAAQQTGWWLFKGHLPACVA
ncbi:MAG: NADH-quinone oxidoreductase subunit H, partial [Chitinophagaceae bacterium]|nr:NADH-quinone oxidoreductase subunit H [Chitinophagaceae bacterium]